MYRNDNQKKRRMTLLAILCCLLAVLCCARLLSYQIVAGGRYAEAAEMSTLTTQRVRAARGEIRDAAGQAIAASEPEYNISFDRAGMGSGQENEIIYALQTLLTELGDGWVDTLPITAEPAFTGEEKSKTALTELLELPADASAAACMTALVERYELGSYPAEVQRQIAGVRYQMEQSGFSLNTPYTFAKGVGAEAAVAVSEQAYRWGGVSVVTEANRVYPDGRLAPHLIGRLSPIYAEEYEEKRDEGYTMDAQVGRDGLEELLEAELRGTDGIYRIARNAAGEVTERFEEQAVTPGHSVKLTLHAGFQKRVQDMLANHISYLNRSRSVSAGGNAYAGSVVVLDPKTGGVLAMATYPSYDINTFADDYQALAADTRGKPLLNRATQELYRPGSTFKTATATAGLIEGLVDRHSSVNCTGVYTYWASHIFHCAGVHHYTDAVKALQYSCNIYFYDLGRRLGQDIICGYAGRLGLGEPTGFELGESSASHLASSGYYAERGLEWNEGNVVNIAIGQDETYVTPLQMAVQAMTIANRGVRYKVHIIDEITDFAGDTVLSKTEPTVADNSLAGHDEAFSIVTEGMVAAAGRVGSYPLTGLGFDVAIKTGTPQRTANTYNSAVIGFAPADNPQIAFAAIIEEGESASFLVRQIIDAYQETTGVSFSG